MQSLSVKLGLDVTNEVLEVEALQEKLGISSFEVRNTAAQDEVSQRSLQFGIMPPPPPRTWELGCQVHP